MLHGVVIHLPVTEKPDSQPTSCNIYYGLGGIHETTKTNVFFLFALQMQNHNTFMTHLARFQ